MSNSRSNRPQSERTRARTSAGSPSSTGKKSGAAPASPAAKSGPAARAKASTGPPPAIETVELAKRYGDAPALWPLDLRIGAGERICLGMNLANVLLEEALGLLVKSVMIPLRGDPSPVSGVTLGPRGPLMINRL